VHNAVKKVMTGSAGEKTETCKSHLATPGRRGQRSKLCWRKVLCCFLLWSQLQICRSRNRRHCICCIALHTPNAKCWMLSPEHIALWRRCHTPQRTTAALNAAHKREEHAIVRSGAGGTRYPLLNDPKCSICSGRLTLLASRGERTQGSGACKADGHHTEKETQTHRWYTPCGFPTLPPSPLGRS